MRLTYGQLVQDSRITIPLNLAATDPRLRQYVNEACERIFWTGENFFGLTQRIVLCLYDGCITFPRQVASIEAIAICDQPLQIRNQWFEFNENSGGLRSGSCSDSDSTHHPFGPCGGMQSYDRGTACTFADIVGADKKVRVYADVAEDAEAVITLLGYDENGQWIRTQVSGEWIDGEQVAISTTPTLSTKIFTNLTAVQKPITNGFVRLYEYSTTLTTQRALAVYEPSETLPVYRRSQINGIGTGTGCCDSDDECALTKVTAIARMEFIPAVVDADWILPANPSAIKDMVQAIRMQENNEPQQALICEGRALNALRSQLRHYLGHGIVQPIRMQDNRIANAGGVRNLI